ncbi:sulfatase family protein [Aeoliella mucimassa]|uniref:Arylsulfatase n=1 Tax=Aeoliella mucimassa TaxID=2527972 RepID=A0A518AW73_9BACT|nr:arylsulfatase [Aeoliella mucimassa]QDU58973.1 Arylsulfatase [Aeoliella mucimassa]
MHSIAPAILLTVALPALLGAAATEPQRPNVLVIVSDDQGWNDVGYHNSELRTPHLDRLAREGVELDCHYVQPQCTPTRVALMTGRYPSRFGLHATHASNDQAYAIGTPTMARMFKQAGYSTGMSGKWHMGSLPKWGPNHHGFDYSHGALAGAIGMYDHRYRLNNPKYTQTWHRNLEFIEETGHATDLTCGETVKWIREHKESGPWFFYVPLNAVHAPIVEGDPKWHAMNEHIENIDRRFFAAALSHMDSAIGEMVTALEETGQRDNTLIVFTSDNGGIHGTYSGGNYPPPDPRLEAGFSSNLPLRGGKTEAFEGGMRVPALASWPGVLKPQKMTTPMHVVDWMPTFANLVGGEAPAAVPEEVDGRDVWPLLMGKSPPANLEPRTLYWVWGSNSARVWEAVRHGDWKIVRRRNQPWQLYDLSNDPNESTNLADDHPDRLAEMIERYQVERAKDAPSAR